MRILDSCLFMRLEMDRAFYAVGRLFFFFRLFLKSREGGATRSIQDHTGRASVGRNGRSFDVVTAGKGTLFARDQGAAQPSRQSYDRLPGARRAAWFLR